MEISEKELEDYIYDTECLKEFDVYGKYFRQVNVGGYGVIDLLYVNIERYPFDLPVINITIVELKKGTIDPSALEQICRYKIGLTRYIDSLNIRNPQVKENINIDGVLVGSGYSNAGDICFTIDSIDWLRCIHYDVALKDGISFDESCGWYKTNESFSGLDKIKSLVQSDYIEYCREQKKESMEGKFI